MYAGYAILRDTHISVTPVPKKRMVKGCRRQTRLHLHYLPIWAHTTVIWAWLPDSYESLATPRLTQQNVCVLSYDVAKPLVMKLLRVLLATFIFICPDTGEGQGKFTAVILGSFLREIFWFYIVEPP